MKVIKYIVCLALVVGFLGLGASAMTQSSGDIEVAKRADLSLTAPYMGVEYEALARGWMKNRTPLDVVLMTSQGRHLSVLKIIIIDYEAGAFIVQDVGELAPKDRYFLNPHAIATMRAAEPTK